MTALRILVRVVAFTCVFSVLAGASGATAGDAPPSALVEHATVSLSGSAVELWGDPATSVIVFRRVGEASVVIVRGLVVEHVDDAHLSELASYRSVSSAWFGVHLRYGLGLAAARAALAAGDQVARPALMTAPTPRWPTSTYTYTRVWDFDIDLGALRRAMSFPVPRPGARLAGLRLADVARVRTRGPGRADTGLTALIEYSSDPARRGTDDRELTLNAATTSGGMEAADAALFKTMTVRLVGPDYDARLANVNQAILRYHGTYIAITATWMQTRAAWRTLLAQITR